MGYPEWTLIGMGLSLLGALIALIFALLGQSPNFTTRLGMAGARLDLRVRAFTTYALALLLLAMGFFLAGVPIDSETEDIPESTLAMQTEDSSDLDIPPSDNESGVESTLVAQESEQTAIGTPETGSFSGPPASNGDVSPEETREAIRTTQAADVQASEGTSPPDQDEPVDGGFTDEPERTATPTALATSTPTETPPPTITPTPITGETAFVESGGSTVWVSRSPGGQNLTLVRDGDIVLLLSGHANQGGVLWREIRTVNGIEGWIQELFLEY
jgi:hypothetical protein